ncbi:hypothetical protein [Sandaracinobacteroides hominis]|jgi:hypothetical protein|nr:hypothetical protein [Sandaracinobacteroides hominis]
MVDVMSNRQILLIAIALGFIGGFSFVAAANTSGYDFTAQDYPR